MTKTYSCLIEGIASTVFHVKDRMACVVRHSRTGECLLSRPMAAYDMRRVRAYAKWQGQVQFRLVKGA